MTATEQVRGFGTRLMNIYKDLMRKKGIEYLLTYADNYAIGILLNQVISKNKDFRKNIKSILKNGGGRALNQIH